jgi:hypothetical protein
MYKNQFTSKEYFNALNIMYISLILGQVFFAVITVFLNLNGLISFNFEESKLALVLIAIILAFSGIYGSNYVFKIRLNNIKQTAGLFNKLIEYRSASILKWAILEAPSFLAIIGYFLTGDMTFIIITIAIIAFFAMNRPSPEKTCIELELDTQYKIKLMDPDAVISESDR